MSSKITIGKDALRDQRKRMKEEWGLSEEEAEEAFKDVKTQVMMASQDLGKNWSDDVVNAVTNIVMAIQYQQYQQSKRHRSHFYDRLFRFLTGSMITAFAGFGIFLILTGNFVFGGVFLIMWVVAMNFQNLFQ